MRDVLKFRGICLMLCAGIMMGVCSRAQADVWAYVDEAGVTRFSAQKQHLNALLLYKSSQALHSPHGNGVLSQVNTTKSLAVPLTRAQLQIFFDISPDYRMIRHHVQEAAREHGVDVALLQAVMSVESGLNPQAVSPRGAVGLMQIMPTTAQRFGVKAESHQHAHEQLLNPRINVHTGARYLSYLLQRYNDRLDLVLAAYNAGEGAVQRAGRRVPSYAETQDYVSVVMQLYKLLQPPPSLSKTRS